MCNKLEVQKYINVLIAEMKNKPTCKNQAKIDIYMKYLKGGNATTTIRFNKNISR